MLPGATSPGIVGAKQESIWSRAANNGAAESPMRVGLLQIDNMLNGTSILDDDDRFADLPALPLVNDSGDAVALPDLTTRASWEACCATLREGLSQMQPAQVCNQVCSSLSIGKNCALPCILGTRTI